MLKINDTKISRGFILDSMVSNNQCLSNRGKLAYKIIKPNVPVIIIWPPDAEGNFCIPRHF